MVDRYFLKKSTDNLNHPGGQINVGGAIVATTDSNFAVKSQMRLESASNLSQLYKIVIRSINNNMIQWDPIIKEFKQECEILVERKE